MSAMWHEAFWRGYICGAAVVMSMLLPALCLTVWESHTLRLQMRKLKEQR